MNQNPGVDTLWPRPGGISDLGAFLVAQQLTIRFKGLGFLWVSQGFLGCLGFRA